MCPRPRMVTRTAVEYRASWMRQQNALTPATAVGSVRVSALGRSVARPCVCVPVITATSISGGSSEEESAIRQRSFTMGWLRTGNCR